jgi:hypothetical protein
MSHSRTKNRWLTLLLAGAAGVMGAALLPGAVATASAVTGVRADASSPVPAVIQHRVTGCGRPMTVYTPRTPAAGLPASALGLPGGPHSILALAAQRHVRWLSTLGCRERPELHHNLPATASVFQTTSGNWSGYADATSIQPNYAQMFWTVPQLGSAEALGDTDYSSIWPGIGSGVGGELIQDGTEQYVSCGVVLGDCANSGQTNFFWLEAVPADPFEEEVTNLTPNTGDSVAAAVYWSSSTGAEFTLCDFTQNECVTGSQSVAGPDNWAEWIIERPTLCITGQPVLPSLAPYGNLTVTGAGYDETPLGELEYSIFPGDAIFTNQIDMYDADNNLLAAASSLGDGNSSFISAWLNYGAATVENGTC